MVGGLTGQLVAVTRKAVLNRVSDVVMVNTMGFAEVTVLFVTADEIVTVGRRVSLTIVMVEAKKAEFSTLWIAPTALPIVTLAPFVRPLQVNKPATLEDLEKELEGQLWVMEAPAKSKEETERREAMVTEDEVV